MDDVDCREIEERLPWFLHGGLAEDERSEVAAHLERCAACRRALLATREASLLFAGHLPAEAIVDYALGLPVDGLSRAVLELHLAHCDECREELRLVESERPMPAALAESGPPEPPRAAREVDRSAVARRPLRWPTALALAATLAVASGLAVWVAMRGGVPVPESRVAIVELLPESAHTRGMEGERAKLDRGRATTLVLATDRAEAFEEARARLTGADGRLLWEGHGLEPAAAGAYALLLPAGALPAGEVDLELEGKLAGEWTPIARYRLSVEP